MTAGRAITRPELAFCLAGISAALLPHAGRFSPGLLVCFAALGAWRMLGAYGFLPLPERRRRLLWLVKQALAIAAFLGIYVSYQGKLGRDAGVALLAALLGLKVLEMTDERDYYVVSSLAYFLVVTNFFYSQTLLTAGYMFFVVVVITAGLVRFNAASTAFSTAACLRLAGLLVVQSLPLMAIIFLLFPRIPGPLWGLPQDAYSAVTGLSDEMTIGHITRLGVSDEVAFRVEFTDRTPRARDLYWRGPVLWQTDGRTWRTVETLGAAMPVIKHGPTYGYSIMLEPHNERWLPALDAVTNTGEAGRATRDLQLIARQPVKRRLRYSLESATDYRLLELTPTERAAALGLPANRHARTRDLAAAWRMQTAEPAAIVQHALDFFHREGFVYTLTPRALLGDSVDQFLFETREGFCEHFAASFVVLMRAAGIPARVVTGYQGGEFNTVSDYMVIRQRDAHAWAEVYLADRGWVRVDPTAAVAPERVSLGIGNFGVARTPLAILDENSAAVAMWRELANVWDAANYQWSQWVLAYNPQRQRNLLEALGMEDIDYGDLTIALTGAVAAAMLVLAACLLRSRQPQADPVVRLYARFCAKLARAGFPRAPHEGPLAFAARVTAARTDLGSEVLAITRLYTALRYAGANIDLALLRAKIRSFTPQART